MDTTTDNQETECQQVSEALSAHFDGVANAAEKQLATAHLAHCSSCAKMWIEWQSLRLMEQRALEPVVSGDMLPLAPVKTPLHLKAAILRQTVSPPIWQRFWPRLLTGMAVPTFAVTCWLLIVAAPWQQTMPEISTQSNPVPENRVASVPDTSTPLNVTPEKLPPVKAAESTQVSESMTSRSSHQTESRPISVASTPRIRQTSWMVSAGSTKQSTKSTFKKPAPAGNSSSETIVVKTPQVSMASLDRPNSLAVKPALSETVKPIITVAPKPRATEPVLVAALSDEDTTETSTNPVVAYIAANDVRPDDIRLAVENYRAALLDDGSDL